MASKIAGLAGIGSRGRAGGMAALALGLLGSAAGAQATRMVSVDVHGNPGNGDSEQPRVSDDGRYVAFESLAHDLAPGDLNATLDVFVKDLHTGVLVLASRTPAGLAGNGPSAAARLSENGRFVVFWSLASDLVPGDTNGQPDIFVRDLLEAKTVRANTNAAGQQATFFSTHPAISGNGRYVGFSSEDPLLVPGDHNDEADVFVKDLVTGALERVSVASNGAQGDGFSGLPALSRDGSRVAFHSLARLAPGDTNGTWDVYVRDRQAGTTERVSVGPGGVGGDGASEAPSISGDGARVAFHSHATNLVVGGASGRQIYVRDLPSGITSLVSATPGGHAGNGWSDSAAISASGLHVAFASQAQDLVAGDSNLAGDVFLRDLAAGTTVLASLTQAGAQVQGPSFGADVSQDGLQVVFFSSAADLGTNGKRQVFVRDSGCDGDVVAYCTAKLNSSACLPTVSWSGSPRASVSSGFTVAADQLLVGELGVFIYSTAGPAAHPFQGGTLCVQPPVARIGQQVATGAGPCGGHMELDFNTHIHSGIDPALTAGASFWGQFWSRDPGDPFGSSLSDALQGTLCP